MLIIKLFLGSTVAQWLALSPHSKKALGSHPGPSRSFQVLSVWSLHVLPVPAWVYSGYSGFPHHHKRHALHCVNMNECWWWSEGPLALIGSHASVSLPQGSCGY